MAEIEVGINLFFLNLKIKFKEGLFFWKHKKQDRFFIETENVRLEAASLADNIAEINRNIEPIIIIHDYTIKNEELICDLYYEGKVRRNEVEEMLFTFSSSNKLSFNKMDCIAHEYVEDSEIVSAPRLIGTDGQTKKIAMRFSKIKNKNDSFRLKLHINLGKCIISDKEYIISQLKYAKANILEYKVNIVFEDFVPSNIRVYELKRGKLRYEKTITSKDGIFADCVEKADCLSFRTYVFDKEIDYDKNNKK